MFSFDEVGGCSLDAHNGCVVEYEIDRDVELGFHVDDSEVTLNVCIGREFSGADLFFKGVRCDNHVNSATLPDVYLFDEFFLCHINRKPLHQRRLRVTPKSDHEPDNYEDLQSLEFSPLLFGSLERYLPLSIINTDRDVKVQYMRDILRGYATENLRVHKHRA
ncbi:hypothetical protein ACFE04_025149 [Oxalis oulophora]